MCSSRGTGRESLQRMSSALASSMRYLMRIRVAMLALGMSVPRFQVQGRI